MLKWKIIAIPDIDDISYGLKRKEKMIEAKNRDEAESMAWREFPEYHEIMVCLLQK